MFGEGHGALPGDSWSWFHMASKVWSAVEGKFEIWGRGENIEGTYADMRVAVDRDFDRGRPKFCLRGLTVTPQSLWNLHPFKLGPFSRFEYDINFRVYAGDTSDLKVTTSGTTHL